MDVRRGVARNSRRIWTAALEDALGDRWKDFEVGGRSEATFLRLLERLPDTERYETDVCGVYGCLLVNKRKVGKGGAVNRKEGLHSVLRGKLNRLARRKKGLLRDGWNADIVACAGMAEIGLDLIHLHVLRIPNIYKSVDYGIVLAMRRYRMARGIEWQ